MEQLLAASQRYLFIKSTIPTEVEFGILHTFETVDKAFNENTTSNQNNSNDKQKSNIYRFCRYSTWLEAHKATIAAEEAIANATTKAQARLLIQAGVIDTNTNTSIHSDNDSAMSTTKKRKRRHQRHIRDNRRGGFGSGIKALNLGCH